MDMEAEKKRGRFMDDELKVLPTEIITEILSRLPADSTIGSRGICKQWRSLIDHPSFVHTHTRQVISSSSTSNPKKFGNYLIPNSSSSSFGFFLCAQQDRYGFKLELIEYNDGGCGRDEEKSVLEFKPSKPITGHPFLFIGDSWGTIMSSSCNGLVFMGSTKPKYSNDMCICNPFTREYVNLRTNNTPIKEVERQWERTMNAFMAYGFGYNSCTNEYKIVSIYYDDMLKFGKGEVSMYTLGSGKWRNKGEIPYWLFNVCYPGMFANGAIHWFDNKNIIVSFDLMDEEFREVAPKIQPALSPANYFDQYGVLGGCLCVTRTDITRFDESPKDIWVLNVLTTNHNNNNKEEEFSWNKKFSIPGITGKGITSKAAPQVVSKSGKILLSSGTGLVSFDPKTEAFVEDEGNIFPCDYKVKIIPHIKSFVSLRALGEKDAKCFGFSDFLV